MDILITSLSTVFERELLLTFLDQFDKIVYETPQDVKSYIAMHAPPHLKEKVVIYFEIDKDNDPQALFEKSRNLRNKLLQLEAILISTAVTLDEEFINQLRKWVKNQTDRSVLLEIQKNPDLIGGAVVQSRGFITENSFRAYFEKRKSERREYGLQ